MPDAKPQRRFRWLRRLFLGAAVALVALAITSLFAVRHLDWIAKFAIHRIFPGVTAEMGSLRAVSLRRLEVSKLTLLATKSKEPLLTLEGGVVVFSFSDVWRTRLEEVRLTSPNLVVSPDLGDALGVQPAKSAPASSSGNALTWAIGRLVVTNGSLRITRFGEWSPSVAMNFAIDFRNFGVGGAAASEEHATELTNVTAADADGREFLRVPAVGLIFTTSELFAGNRLRAVRIGAGDLTLAPGLLDALQASAPAKPAASSAPGWTIGALDLDALRVDIPNAPGPLGHVEFRVAAALKDLGATDTPAGGVPQDVRLTDLAVATDREPNAPLLTADAARARFSVAGLANRRLEELTLENPALDLAPETLLPPATTPPAKSTAPGAAPAPPWMLAHVHCDYGALRLRGLKAGAVDFAARFAFDLHDLGTVGEAGRQTHKITFWDARTTPAAAKSPFLTLDVGAISFTPDGLLAGKRIESLRIDGGRLTVGDALQKLLAADPTPSPPVTTPQSPVTSAWSIGSLDIAGVRTRLEDRRPGVTDLHFTINTTLRNVQAGGAATAVLEEVQTVELANIDLRSPLNRNALIVSLRSVFVRFTLRDLARKHLREVVILRPSIFLSQDLFVYMERATAPDPAAKPVPNTQSPMPAAPAAPSWSVDHLEVKFGRLVLGSGGSKDVGLPLEFETTADNLSLDNLAALQLQAVLRVPKQSYDFPDYQIEVKDVVGDLRFSYPPEKGEKNLVQKLDISAVRWRQYRADKTWIAATFDASGINGLFGGEAYGGYVNGGFSFFFQDDSPWIGWIAGTDVDTKSFTDIISPQNFRLTGPLNFEMQLDAFRKNISRVRGVFHLTEPGHLKIGKLDDLLANLPEGWNSFKRESTRVALETLRDFDYTTAGGDFWFVDSQGILNLDLHGPNGSRKFEVALHDGEETSNQWQQGKLGKK